MLAKILIGSGILIVFVSIIGVVAGIFSTLRTNASAGIGVIGFGTQLALLCIILGALVLVFGCIKLYRDKRAGK